MTRVFWYTDAAPICPGLFKQDWPVPRIIGSFWPPGWGVVLASQQVVQTKGVDTVEAFWALGLRRNWRGSLSHGGSPSHHGLKLKWLNDLDDNWGYSHFWKPPYRALCSLMWPTGYLYRLVGEMTIHQHPPFQVVASLVYDKMEISTEDPNMPWLSLVLQRDENWNTLWMRSVKGLGSEITFLSWKLWNLPRGVVSKWGIPTNVAILVSWAFARIGAAHTSPAAPWMVMCCFVKGDAYTRNKDEQICLSV